MGIGYFNAKTMEAPNERSGEHATNGNTGAKADFASWPLDRLSDYIVNTHHRFAEKQIQILRPNLEKICAVHGAQHPELHQIKTIFWETSGDMARHQKKEEIMLFPFLKKMANARGNNADLKTLPSQAIEERVNMLTEEHDDQEEAFKKMAELSDGFTPPADAPEMYQVTLKLLKALQADLRQHIHLENDLLFPKSLKLLTLLTS